MKQTESLISKPLPSGGHRQGMIWVEVTNGCNLNCDHCYSDSFPGSHVRDKMSHDDYLRVIAEAAELGMSAIQFIGGEPLLYKRLPELVALAQSSGFEHVEIFSNLVADRPDVFDAIDPTKTTIATSVYSDQASVHDRIVKRLGSFKRTVNSIVRLVDKGVGVRAGFIEMEANKGQFDQTRDFLEGIGVTTVGFDRVREFGRGGHDSEPCMSQLCGSCSGSTLCVTYEGDVLPSIMSRAWPIGKIAKMSLREIYESELAAGIRSQIWDATASKWIGTESDVKVTNCDPMCGPYGCEPCGPNCPPNTNCQPRFGDCWPVCLPGNPPPPRPW